MAAMGRPSWECRVGPRRPTIADVARLAGVSTATVSRALNDGGRVSEGKRACVFRAVTELNYRPNDLTRAIFAGRSNTIGVLMADLRNPYYVELTHSISGVATASGTLAYLASGNRDAELERRILSLMDSHRVRGLITTTQSPNDDVVLSMAESGTTCVYITREPTTDHPNIHSVRLDDYAAGTLAWEHLKSIDRTRVLVVSQSLQLSTQRLRVQGLREAAHTDGVEVPEEHCYVLSDLDSVDDELRDLLREEAGGGTINALFATTGIATFRAYEALARADVEIPGQIAMLGLDDFFWADYLKTPLSVIVQPTRTMGETAAQLILREQGDSQRFQLKPSLAVRASTLV